MDPPPAGTHNRRMEPVVYSVLHVAAALVAVVAGFGLHAKLGVEGFPGWLIVKLVAWLVLAGTTGMAFRKPGLASALALVSAVAVIAAVYCAYTKPF